MNNKPFHSSYINSKVLQLFCKCCSWNIIYILFRFYNLHSRFSFPSLSLVQWVTKTAKDDIKRDPYKF